MALETKGSAGSPVIGLALGLYLDQQTNKQTGKGQVEEGNAKGGGEQHL